MWMEDFFFQEVQDSNGRKVSAVFVWQSPINETMAGGTACSAPINFQGSTVLTQRHFLKQNECPHSVMTFNTFKLAQHWEWNILQQWPFLSVYWHFSLPVALAHFQYPSRTATLNALTLFQKACSHKLEKIKKALNTVMSDRYYRGGD